MNVGIVGGGITGLAVHHALVRAGVESVVYEADTRPGGVVRSVTAVGHVLDLGPQRTMFTPGLRELIETTGIGDEVVTAADVPLYVYRSGRLRRAPLRPRTELTTDLVSWRAKLRALWEPVTWSPGVDSPIASSR